MLNTHDSIVIIDELHKLSDISSIQEITIDKHCPSFESSQERSEESSEGKFSAFCGIFRASIDPNLTKLRLLDGDDFERKGGVFEERMSTDFIGKIFTRIITDKDFEFRNGSAIFGECRASHGRRGASKRRRWVFLRRYRGL